MCQAVDPSGCQPTPSKHYGVPAAKQRLHGLQLLPFGLLQWWRLYAIPSGEHADPLYPLGCPHRQQQELHVEKLSRRWTAAHVQKYLKSKVTGGSFLAELQKTSCKMELQNCFSE